MPNLVDKVVEHNVPGGRARVKTGCTVAGAFLTVTSSGPVVRVGGREPLRAVSSARPWTGVARWNAAPSIVEPHGAELRARSQDGGRLEVTRALPRREVRHRGPSRSQNLGATIVKTAVTRSAPRPLLTPRCGRIRQPILASPGWARRPVASGDAHLGRRLVHLLAPLGAPGGDRRGGRQPAPAA